MPRQITKVKEHDGKIIIHYQIVRPDERVDEHTLSCVDPPRPSFHPALQSLAPTFAQWCDLPEVWCKSLTVLGVSFSWAHDIMGATVTASRPSSAAGPLIINAPHKPVEPYSESGPLETCLTEEQILALQVVLEEAGAYIDGDRAQMQLIDKEAA